MFLARTKIRYYGCGIWAGKLFCMVVALLYLIWRLLEKFSPREDIDIAPDFPYEEYAKAQKTKAFKLKEQKTL